jgi:NAD(P)-dependent dehydrogenase (short-subunit alcohol dehydrogenase family)
MDLGGRVALVTGAAGGLGAAHALALARRGACVVAADMLDSSSVVETIVRRGGEAAGVAVDLATPQGCATALSAALELYGEVDILVNNAGVVRDRMSFNLSQDDWEVVLAVNLSASFFLAQGLIRCWRALPSGRDRVIVNTSSESGLHGNAGQANYAAAKAGVAALTVTLASELARYGIRVNAIAPRARTPMSAAAFGGLPRTPEFDPFATEHVAEVVAWLASDAARDVTGQVLVVHGAGVEVMRPWTAIRRVARGRPWTDDDLLKLRGELFPDGATRHLARPVGDLFVSPEAKESTSHAR